MSQCTRYEELIQQLIAEEISPAEHDELMRHVQDCDACRQTLDLHAELGDLGAEMPEPDEEQFRIMRAGVMARLPRESSMPAWSRFFAGLWEITRAEPVGVALTLVLLLGGAVMAGRWSASAARLDDDLILRALRRQAAEATDIAGSMDARFVYSNVTARSLEDGSLALGFDVSRHFEVVTSRESDLATDVLLHAMFDPEPLGTRLKAVAMTTDIMDARLRQAVIFAMHNDPHLAVRLEAFEVMTRYPFDLDVQKALLSTLQHDESVQMRFQALEYLTGQQVGAETLRRTIDAAELDSNDAILQRAVELNPQL